MKKGIQRYMFASIIGALAVMTGCNGNSNNGSKCAPAGATPKPQTQTQQQGTQQKQSMQKAKPSQKGNGTKGNGQCAAQGSSSSQTSYRSANK